jgi:hypothetical protein
MNTALVSNSVDRFHPVPGVQMTVASQAGV